ncbi:hypothetical protein FACS189494_05690 [Spirochaetia bacterium]|nr:hypothetical protein FACS189494_05690 [Spirochaetia bacterium]
MAKKTCSNGHIYDTGIYGDYCPFCTPQNNIGGKTVISGANKNDGKTIIEGGNKTVISPTNDSSNFDDKTQIGTGAKTVIYGHSPEPAASVPPMPHIITPPTSPATTVAGVEVPSQQVPVGNGKGKKKKTGLIIAITAILVVVAVGVIVYFTKFEKPLVENKNGLVIFTQIKNNNSYVDNLKISTNQLRKFIQLGKKKDPNTTVFYNYPDDYRIELFQKALNNGEKLEGVSIYLEGIPNVAGYSSVYGVFLEDDEKRILNFTISFDNEYLDKSGIEFLVFSGWTHSDESLQISKYRYKNTNEIYYRIDWNKDLIKKQRLEILNSFFKKLRYSNVYNDPKFDKKWFAEIYTGIENYQRIGDLFEIK